MASAGRAAREAGGSGAAPGRRPAASPAAAVSPLGGRALLAAAPSPAPARPAPGPLPCCQGTGPQGRAAAGGGEPRSAALGVLVNRGDVISGGSGGTGRGAGSWATAAGCGGPRGLGERDGPKRPGAEKGEEGAGGAGRGGMAQRQRKEGCYPVFPGLLGDDAKVSTAYLFRGSTEAGGEESCLWDKRDRNAQTC